VVPVGLKSSLDDKLASFNALTLLVGSSGLLKPSVKCVEWDVKPLLTQYFVEHACFDGTCKYGFSRILHQITLFDVCCAVPVVQRKPSLLILQTKSALISYGKHGMAYLMYFAFCVVEITDWCSVK